MNRNHTLRSVAALAVAGALSACGGGGAEEALPTSPQQLQAFNELADYCGAVVPRPANETSQSMQQLAAYTVTRDRVGYPVTTAYALNGFTAADDKLWPLPVPLTDFRGLGTGPYVSPGLAFADVQMGVLVPNVFPRAGITCVKGVAGMRDNLDGTKTVVWRSRDQGALDLSRLPGPIVDGFEWLANYAPGTGTVAFTLRRPSADPATARICHRTPAATGWTCVLPIIAASATSFTFSMNQAVPGVYLLSVDKPATAQ